MADRVPKEYEQSENRPTGAPWYAVPDDEIGGWAVANTNAAPSRHDPTRGDQMVANVNRRADAELICALRNLAAVDLAQQLEERGSAAGN